MTQVTLSPDVLVPWGKALLLASFAFCLLRTMRGSSDLQISFERLALALLALFFFKGGADVLSAVSQDLTGYVERLGHRDDLKSLIREAFKRASGEAAADGSSVSLNLPAILEQAWRTGVWGVMSTIVDWMYLVVGFLLETAREVFWKIMLFLFPLACGVYPVFPKMLTNLALYAVELALWFPVLAMVEVATGTVARAYLTQSGSLGLNVVAVELIAIILMLLIPSVTHKFLGGAFGGDFDTQSGLIRTAKRAAFAAKSWGIKT